jgi:CHAT domain-containing protein
VGVGDPIYNLADSRLAHSKGLRVHDRAKESNSAAVLSRIPASEPEVKASAEKCGMPQVELLLGKDASIPKLRDSVLHAPQILHFAVHVISPKNFPQEAAIALSAVNANLPELLTAESVATFSVPGSLVVLSGCASQQGAVVPGAGLIGLSRSWLLAGAAAVMVSAWPTPDNSSSFFPTFYTHYRLATGSVAQRAAFALQQTQVDMQHIAGHQSDPKFWAAYSIISRE